MYGSPDHDPADPADTAEAADAAGAAGAWDAEEAVFLPADLHARPAALLVRTAARYAADVELVVSGRVARASSVLAVMGLGARAGAAVTVRARGADAAEAVAALGGFLRATED